MSDAGWLTWMMSAMATLLLATWFITSSDSGTLVITTFLSMGDPHPPRRFRIVWGLGVGAVAAVLLLADGLQALQTAAIAAALPVSVVLLVMIAGLLKSCGAESVTDGPRRPAVSPGLAVGRPDSHSAASASPPKVNR